MIKLKAFCAECGKEWIQDYPDDSPTTEPAATYCSDCLDPKCEHGTPLSNIIRCPLCANTQFIEVPA